MSEIDDIFASKGKAKEISASPTIKSSKKKKRVSVHLDTSSSSSEIKDAASSSLSPSKKRRQPETVVDTSNNLSGPSKRQKIDDSKNSKPGKGEKSKQAQDDLTNFKDSRGSSDRKKTAEGWLVYKEDELGISQEGGGMISLCFSVYFTASVLQTPRCVPLIVIAVFKWNENLPTNQRY
ncbi:hypothetical protein CPB83DRAFT_56702 [Crepidotus variabilis]|uniref:Uncharacterized protein n=1 Tax=Crepidotus variabilis TaxID=179855 RepID=A0A9P6EP01_9AGAR|nr:hypothetical protein CPB83DRAFT_56702 [Crepidotus variabilis]